MADNKTTQSGTLASLAASVVIATRDVTYSGDANAQIAPTGLVVFSGSDDAKTATDVTGTNPLPVTSQGATATLANVAESASAVTLLASNASRFGWSIYNDSDAALNVKFGSGASATSFVIRVLPRGFTSHKDFMGAVYTGIITGIWDSTPGTTGHVSARTMELTV
jgi:hypothetical protein